MPHKYFTIFFQNIYLRTEIGVRKRNYNLSNTLPIFNNKLKISGVYREEMYLLRRRFLILIRLVHLDFLI